MISTQTVPTAPDDESCGWMMEDHNLQAFEQNILMMTIQMLITVMTFGEEAGE